METMIHFATLLDARPPVIEQLEGVAPNKQHGAVTAVKAVSGRQQFACCTIDSDAKKAGLCMTKHAGKQYEGANHGATGEPQFVNCPYCKEAPQYKEAMAEHERHTATDKGLFAGIFHKQGASLQRGAEGALVGADKVDSVVKTEATEELLPAGN